MIPSYTGLVSGHFEEGGYLRVSPSKPETQIVYFLEMSVKVPSHSIRNENLATDFLGSLKGDLRLSRR
jgi:hypothetical protein